MRLYKWKIEIILKSGKELVGYYKGEESDSKAVSDKFFVGNKNELIGFYNEDETKNIVILRDEIAAMTISTDMR